MSTDVEMSILDSGGAETPPPPIQYPDLVNSIALFLANKVKAHDIKFTTTKNPRTHFTALVPVQIPIDAYLFHLMGNVRTSPAVVLYMLIYLERVISAFEKNYQKQNGTDVPFLMTSYNAHRLLLTAFLLAHKYCEDCRYSTIKMARIGGIDPKEMKKLETEFLKFINYRLYVSEEQFEEYRIAVLLFGQELVLSSMA
eukprot:CAMPEP_0168326574 /NCGR_PEP_ID=MMETSP0213-20121227/5379_1 /TAXON_ID=151035 /ORGANISM="Euplotes harpa, Strain FSP1.4" /LENGTH=197 /DNA_ID=CAMNT_0008329305 /DNA_START=18 /DNA_END=611 /DNA_ORIENTATION=-